MDGSQKIRNAVVPPLEYQLSSSGSGSIKWKAFALSAWYTYELGVDVACIPIEVFSIKV